MTTISDRRYRPSEVARILEEPRSTVYDWIKRGLIDSVKRGRKIWVTNQELERVRASKRLDYPDESDALDK